MTTVARPSIKVAPRTTPQAGRELYRFAGAQALFMAFNTEGENEAGVAAEGEASSVTGFFSKEVVNILEETIYHKLAQCALEQAVPLDGDIFRDLYERRVKDFVKVLRIPARREALLGAVTSVEQLGTQKSWDLYPEPWQHDLQGYATSISQMGERQRATSNLYQCSKCKKSETSYYELQTRSQDEPMTMFITCVNCGHHWKQ